MSFSFSIDTYSSTTRTPGRLLSLGEAIQMSLETPLQLVCARGRTAGKERGSQVLGPHHHFD